MSYHFAGQEFRTLAEFQRTYPIYRNYTDLLKSGVDSVMAMEKAIKERNDNWKASSLKQARANNTFKFTRKKA
jgi:hypothetical protein